MGRILLYSIVGAFIGAMFYFYLDADDLPEAIDKFTVAGEFLPLSERVVSEHKKGWLSNNGDILILSNVDSSLGFVSQDQGFPPPDASEYKVVVTGNKRLKVRVEIAAITNSTVSSLPFISLPSLTAISMVDGEVLSDVKDRFLIFKTTNNIINHYLYLADIENEIVRRFPIKFDGCIEIIGTYLVTGVSPEANIVFNTTCAGTFQIDSSAGSQSIQLLPAVLNRVAFQITENGVISSLGHFTREGDGEWEPRKIGVAEDRWVSQVTFTDEFDDRLSSVPITSFKEQYNYFTLAGDTTSPALLGAVSERFSKSSGNDIKYAFVDVGGRAPRLSLLAEEGRTMHEFAIVKLPSRSLIDRASVNREGSVILASTRIDDGVVLRTFDFQRRRSHRFESLYSNCIGKRRNKVYLKRTETGTDLQKSFKLMYSKDDFFWRDRCNIVVRDGAQGSIPVGLYREAETEIRVEYDDQGNLVEAIIESKNGRKIARDEAIVYSRKHAKQN